MATVKVRMKDTDKKSRTASIAKTTATNEQIVAFVKAYDTLTTVTFIDATKLTEEPLTLDA